MTVTIRDATYEDIPVFLEKIRAVDKAEMNCAGHTDHAAALRKGIDLGPAFYVSDKDGPILMAGFSAHDENKAVVWMLGTPRIETLKWPFLKISRSVFEQWSAEYSVLTNRVWAANTVHIRWLEWLGCTFTEEVWIGRHKFLTFEKVRNV